MSGKEFNYEKIFKKAIVGALSGCIALSTMIISAGAYRVTKSNVGTFEWYSYRATTTNTSNNSRLTDAVIKVFEDNTGIEVTTLAASKVGTYGTNATVHNNDYPSSKYNYEIYGHVYNGGSTMSGSLWFTGIKVLD